MAGSACARAVKRCGHVHPKSLPVASVAYLSGAALPPCGTRDSLTLVYTKKELKLLYRSGLERLQKHVDVKHCQHVYSPLEQKNEQLRPIARNVPAKRRTLGASKFALSQYSERLRAAREAIPIPTALPVCRGGFLSKFFMNPHMPMERKVGKI